jgi:hypothetical protein
MKDCPHLTNGVLCDLVAPAAGLKFFQVRPELCLPCPGSDDGKGYASQSIIVHLRIRIARSWQKVDACCGSTISLADAVARLKARMGDKAGETILAAVKFNGMPKETAKALVVAHLQESVK